MLSQLRALVLLLVSNMFLNLYVVVSCGRELQQVGLFGFSLMFKFCVPFFGWSKPLVTAALCCTCVAPTLAYLWSSLSTGASRDSILIATDQFFAMAAGVFWLAFNLALQKLFDLIRSVVDDNIALRQVMTLSYDGQLCISLTSQGDLRIEKATPQFVHLIGCDVEGRFLHELMWNDTEYRHVLDALMDMPEDPIFRSSAMMNDCGQALQIEFLAVQLRCSSAAQAHWYGTLNSYKQHDSDAIYLVAVRHIDQDTAHNTGTPAVALTSSRTSRVSPAESVGSVLPNVLGRVAHSDSSIKGPSPDACSSAKQSGSSEVFKNGQIDMTDIINLGHKEHWLIDTKEVQVLPYAILGSGGFGIVVEAVYYGITLAAKITKKPQRESSGNRSLAELKSSALQQELRMLRHVRHPNIVQFYGACLEPQSQEIVILFEKVEAPILSHFLTELSRSMESKSLKSAQCRIKVMLDISRALAYLHARKNPVVHGDLKPANIFVESKSKGPNAMLSDFGLARKITKRTTQRPGFTIRWGAPEVVLGTSDSTTKADVFSYGRLMSYVVTGTIPLDGMDESAIYRSLRSHSPLPKPAWPANRLAEICSGLAESCMALTTEQRPQMMSILRLMEKAPELLMAAPIQGKSSSSSNGSGLLSLLPTVSHANSRGTPDGGASSRVNEDSGLSGSREDFLRALELARRCALSNNHSHLT
eukprot:TRINITY_DN15221_c0_g1_i1.p1 TRINITY_DN15221_c0_g1~~TRINITY_DN15221_c0_g1_i1.p1  ORF type:complete len:701 (-),score=77.10 TRINITY_DN15221_c0_g1_i1:564-2666(-)